MRGRYPDSRGQLIRISTILGFSRTLGCFFSLIISSFFITIIVISFYIVFSFIIFSFGAFYWEGGGEVLWANL